MPVTVRVPVREVMTNKQPLPRVVEELHPAAALRVVLVVPPARPGDLVGQTVLASLGTVDAVRTCDPVVRVAVVRVDCECGDDGRERAYKVQRSLPSMSCRWRRVFRSSETRTRTRRPRSTRPGRLVLLRMACGGRARNAPCGLFLATGLSSDGAGDPFGATLEAVAACPSMPPGDEGSTHPPGPSAVFDAAALCWGSGKAFGLSEQLPVRPQPFGCSCSLNPPTCAAFTAASPSSSRPPAEGRTGSRHRSPSCRETSSRTARRETQPRRSPAR